MKKKIIIKSHVLMRIVQKIVSKLIAKGVKNLLSI